MNSVQTPLSPPQTACWIVTDGNAGMENQCLGLAEALGVRPIVKRIRLRAPWNWLPPRLGALGNPLRRLDPAGDALDPPWPELLIATGRKTVAVTAAIRRISNKTVAVQIQNPHFPSSAFDLIVAPRHDGLNGGNIICTAGALHRVTRARLDKAAEEFRAGLAHLPRPLFAVLIGGPNKVYRMNPSVIERLCAGLRHLTSVARCSFAVTPSRRTGEANITALRQGLKEVPHILWEGQGANPYFGFLGLADAVVVTADSVNMISEAAATGKPVFVFDLPGGSAKFRAFHAGMRESGAVRPFVPDEILPLESWTPPEIDDTAMVVRAVRRLLIIRNH